MGGMPRAYSLDLRERLLRARDAGLSAAEVERTLGVSGRTQRRWTQRVAAGAALAADQPPGRARKIPPDAEAALRGQVAASPDATLADHCARWAATTGATGPTVRVSTATMSRTLTRLGLPLKKRR